MVLQRSLDVPAAGEGLPPLLVGPLGRQLLDLRRQAAGARHLLPQLNLLVLRVEAGQFLQCGLVVDLRPFEQRLQPCQRFLVLAHGPDVLVVLFEQCLAADCVSALVVLQRGHDRGQELLVLPVLLPQLLVELLVLEVLLRPVLQPVFLRHPDEPLVDLVLIPAPV